MNTPVAAVSAAPAKPSFGEALRFWVKLGWVSFGGPAGQIAIMQHELVERRRWIGQERFLHALNYCMLLPGPEAQQLAIYCGWLLHRGWGGIAAGVLFVLPGALLLWGLAWLYVAHGELRWVAAVFAGLKPAVAAVVAVAVMRIGGKALRTPALVGVAAAAFGLIFFLNVGFPWIVAGSGVLGWAGHRWRADWFPAAGGHGGLNDEARAVVDDTAMDATGEGWSRAVKVLAVGGGMWAVPVLAATAIWGWYSTVATMGRFFSVAAMVTFGGAYAVLPYVAQRAVETYGWVTGPEMLAGLALAETTPGPLILVLQFVGFLGGWAAPDAGLSPMAAGTVCAAMTTWATFAPSFVWVFLGAPYVERLRGRMELGAALGAVTAAVVGVILNLAVWFAWQTWRPGGAEGAWDGFALGVSVVAFVALHRFKLSLMAVIGLAALAGLARGAWMG